MLEPHWSPLRSYFTLWILFGCRHVVGEMGSLILSFRAKNFTSSSMKDDETFLKTVVNAIE